MNKISSFISNQKNKIDGAILFLITFVLSSSYAHADYDIGGPDSGPLAKITAFAQDLVNWVDGPVALAFSFFTLAGMAITWAVAPKFVSALGLFGRVALAIIIILNLGAWIAAFQS